MHYILSARNAFRSVVARDPKKREQHVRLKTSLIARAFRSPKACSWAIDWLPLILSGCVTTASHM